MALVAWIASTVSSPLPLPPASLAGQRYTPSPATNIGTAANSAQGVSPTSIHHQAFDGTSHGSSMQLNTLSPIPSTPTPPHNSLWVIFGVKDTFEFDDIECINIESMLMNDPSFFAELRRLDSKYRWRFLRWFSPWIFTHCKFVRVCTLSYNHIAKHSVLTCVV